ncbi:LOW QUALITY PROTEIN: intraflagellar transport protein 56-like [Podargus strigoides]
MRPILPGNNVSGADLRHFGALCLLLQQVGSNECSNNSYVINVMLMNYLDFPSTTDNVKLAVKQALERVQNEFQKPGENVTVNATFHSFTSSLYVSQGCRTSTCEGVELIKEIYVVFRGEGALQVIPEARLNLVIYYLQQDDVQEAYNLIKDLEPTAPQEYILKGVVNAALGQEIGSSDHLKIAQQFFQLVGESASECDTIPGRQCMSSCFFLLRQFSNVLIYLNSVKSYFSNDDTFNFNCAQAKAAMSNFGEAEEVFLLIQSEKIKNDFVYLSWLAHSYIINKKPQSAWKLYVKMEPSGESFSLLQLIANDCYKMRQFYYSAKAFDALERLDSNSEYWNGKIGACVGVFQMILARREAKETLWEVLHLLKSTGCSPQVEYIVRIMKRWAKENRVPV